MPKPNYPVQEPSPNTPDNQPPANASTPADREAAAVAEINQVLARYGSILTRRNRGTMLDEGNGVRVEAVNEVPAETDSAADVGAFPNWSENVNPADPQQR